MKRSASALIAVAACLCSGISLHAQSEGAQPESARRGAAVPASAPARQPLQRPSGPTISVSFSGGTVAEYVESLRDAADPFPVNVTYAGGADGSPMPPIEFKSVALSGAINLIEEYTRDNPLFRLDVAELRSSTDATAEQAPAPIFVIRLVPMNERGPLGPQQVRVLSLAELICPPPGSEPASGTTLSAEVILSALEAALKMAPSDPAADQPQLKFHPDSGLLIIRGSPEHTDLAIRTIESLEMPIRSARASARAAAERPATIEAERAREALKSMDEQATTLRERCHRLEDELQNVRVQLQQRETELTLIINDLQRQLQQKPKNPG